MIWRLRYTNAAKRDIRKLPEDVRRRVAEELDSLMGDPRPEGSVRLRGTHNDYRLRLDEYRALYRITGEKVLITRVEKRSEHTYRGYNPHV